MNLSYDSVAALYKTHNYRFYDTGKFNVNLFGIRKSLLVDLFDDVLGVAFRDANGKPILKVYSATTKPGLYWLKNKLGNVKGTFILQPGYYHKCWTVGKHKGEYEALVQSGPRVFRGWRDSDADGTLDTDGPIFTDVAGLNLHTTSHLRGKADRIGAYSASCQVIQYTKDHLELMGIVKASRDLYGNIFSYALFNQQ